MTNISLIAANLKAFPLQKPNRFQVMITGPVGFLAPPAILNCHSCGVPGRSFDTANLQTYGPARKVPYVEIFDQVTTSFWVTETMLETMYFQRWMDLIGGEGGGSFNIGYYDNIVGQVAISPITSMGIPFHIFQLFEAYPIQVQEIPFDMSSSNQYASLSITWAFHHYEMK